MGDRLPQRREEQPVKGNRMDEQAAPGIQVIPLYDTVYPGGSCGMSTKAWSTLPYNGNDGTGSECRYFYLPPEFERRVEQYGTFIVHRESNKISPIGLSFDSMPMVFAPDMVPVVLEFADEDE